MAIRFRSWLFTKDGYRTSRLPYLERIISGNLLFRLAPHQFGSWKPLVHKQNGRHTKHKNTCFGMSVKSYCFDASIRLNVWIWHRSNIETASKPKICAQYATACWTTIRPRSTEVHATCSAQTLTGGSMSALYSQTMCICTNRGRSGTDLFFFFRTSGPPVLCW